MEALKGRGAGGGDLGKGLQRPGFSRSQVKQPHSVGTVGVNQGK